MSSLTASARTKFDWKYFAQQYGLAISFILLCLMLSFLSDRFLTINNLTNILRQSTINGIISVGMTLVILTLSLIHI